MFQLYNMFPWLGRWIQNRKLIVRHVETNQQTIRDLIKRLKATLSPELCRGLVDCFLIRQQREQVGVGPSMGGVVYPIITCVSFLSGSHGDPVQRAESDLYSEQPVLGWH